MLKRFDEINELGEALGVSAEARRKWKERGRVAPALRLALVELARARGYRPFNSADFGPLKPKPKPKPKPKRRKNGKGKR